MGASQKGQQTAAEGGKKETKKRTRSRRRLVSKVIAKIEEKLEDGEIKPTLGDLARMLQLKKEFEAEEAQPKEVKVSWVERDEKESASEK